jgi:hypothetical protein
VWIEIHSTIMGKKMVMEGPDVVKKEIQHLHIDITKVSKVE